MRYVVVYEMVLGEAPVPVCKCEIYDNFEEAQNRKRDFIKKVNTLHDDAVLKCVVKSYECKIYKETKH